MKHPPYHLRINKAVDRWLLVEVLMLLARHLEGLRGYRYYGLGGPFLEDFRLLGEHFAELPLICLESSEQTHLRQRFHRCAKNVSLRRETVASFLATNSWDERAVYWFDYTDLSPARVQEFESLLDRVPEDSVVKITLRASLDSLPDFVDRRTAEISDEELDLRRQRYLEDFAARWSALVPPDTDYGKLRGAHFPALLQAMLRVAAQRALPPGSGRRFQILHSCFYSDHTQMLSLAGVVCRDEDARRYRLMFRDWPHRNLRWARPKRIDVPVLSTKERMLLEAHLPARRSTGKALRRALGYNVDEGGPESIRKLKQYAVFYRHYPYFGRVAVV